jgi:hypothetical protein
MGLSGTEFSVQQTLFMPELITNKYVGSSLTMQKALQIKEMSVSAFEDVINKFLCCL